MIDWIDPKTDPPPYNLNVWVLSEVGPVVAYRTHNGHETVYVVRFTNITLTKVYGWQPIPVEEPKKPKRGRPPKSHTNG